MPNEPLLFLISDTFPHIRPQKIIGHHKDFNSIQKSLPEGVYTTLRTYEKSKLLSFRQHVKRLNESAALLGANVRVDEQTLKNALKAIMAQLPYQNSRIRINLDLTSSGDNLYVIAQELAEVDPELYKHGVEVVTKKMHRDNPKAKSTQFVSHAEEIRRDEIIGVHEVIMVSPTGELLEGLSSNFFAIMDKKVLTASDEVLSGITRGLVLDLLDEKKIPVYEHGIQINHVKSIDEAFITSVSRGILPVVAIDNIVIGEGTPGPITKSLIDLFSSAIEALLEEI